MTDASPSWEWLISKANRLFRRCKLVTASLPSTAFQSPGNTMGQVWAVLGGSPGKERKLTIERDGKPFVVVAPVRHFLGVIDEEDNPNEEKQIVETLLATSLRTAPRKLSKKPTQSAYLSTTLRATVRRDVTSYVSTAFISW